MALRKPLILNAGVVEQLDPADTLNVDAAAVFNDSGADVDFRIEGDTTPNLLLVDASQDALRLGGTTIGDVAIFSCAVGGARGLTINPTTDGDADFIVHGDTVNFLVYADVSADALKIGSSNGDWLIASSTGIVVNETGADRDLRIEGDTATNLLFIDASIDAVQIGTTVAGQMADFRSTAIVFNNNAADIDFTVKGDTTNNLFKTDAGLDAVQIGGATAGTIADFRASIVVLNEAGGDQDLRIEGDTATSLLVCDAGLDAFQIGDTVAGSRLDIRSTGAVVNEQGADADFRIEGDSLTHMLFMDASAATENIALVATAAPNWQSMDRGLFIGDATTIPTADSTDGVFLYVDPADGHLYARSDDSTVKDLMADSGSVSEGGVYEIKYKFNNATSNNPANGYVQLNDATQGSATEIYLDYLDDLGVNWGDALTGLVLFAGTTLIDGYVRLVKRDDPTKWILFAIDEVDAPLGGNTFATLSVTFLGQSGANPLTDEDEVTLTLDVRGRSTLEVSIPGGDIGDLTSLEVIAPANVPAEHVFNNTGNAGTLRLTTRFVDAQIRFTNGNWIRPEDVGSGTGMRVEILCIAGGAGGGAGRRGASGSNRSGGGGGGGGATIFAAASLADLVNATEPIVVGTGGAGANGQTVNDNNGANGSPGNNTTFGSGTGGAPTVTANGGTAGSGGGTTSGTAGTGGGSSTTGAASSSQFDGQNGGAGSNGAGAAGSGGARWRAGGGGGGGGISNTNTSSVGGVGGSTLHEGVYFNFQVVSITSPGGTAGATSGAGGDGVGTTFTFGPTTGSPGAGGGGGGGGAGAGGTGAFWGGGGGGGGASLNGTTSGAGGAGRAGMCAVWSYLNAI